MTRVHRNPARPVLRTAFFAGVCGLLCSGAVFGQGCVSCYTSAAAGGSQTIHALRSGILVLLFPPVFIFGGIVSLLWRWRSRWSSNPGKA